MSAPGLALRVLLLAVAIGLLAPVQWLGGRLGWRGAARTAVLVHRLFLRLFSIRVRVVGAPPCGAVPTLILANHVSWLDIPVMGSLVPLAFIAKSEIAGWPVFGALAKLQRCIFLDRSRKGATAEVNAVVARRLAAGEAIVLFPEGTTGDGIRLLPFRSSLVGAVRAAIPAPEAPRPDGRAASGVRLQPLAIVYAGRGGLPVGRREMPELAWYGDMELPSHLSGFLKGGPVDVAVVWGEPVPAALAADRKRATAAAEASVRAAVARVRAGLPEPAMLAGPNALQPAASIEQVPRPA